MTQEERGVTDGGTNVKGRVAVGLCLLGIVVALCVPVLPVAGHVVFSDGEVSWTVCNLLAYAAFFMQLGALMTGYFARNRSGYIAMVVATPLLVLGYLIMLVESAGPR